MSTIKIDYAGGPATLPPKMYTEEGDECRELRLYQVTTVTQGNGTLEESEPTFVLAHNAVEAERMHARTDDEATSSSIRVKRITMMVHGWGDNKF